MLSKKNNGNKNIHRKSAIGKEINFIFGNHNKQKQIIDNLIKTKEANRRRYSQTLAIPYIPLTKKQKVKEIFDMDKSCQNRFNEYSNIFEQIKNQISDINYSLENINNSQHIDRNDNRLNSHKYKTKTEHSIHTFIDEKDEDNIVISKKQSNVIQSKDDNEELFFIDKEFENEKEKIINNDNDIENKIDNSFSINNFNNENDNDDFDNNGIDENTRNIYLNYSRSPNSLKNTKRNNRIFLKKKYLKHNINFDYKERSLSKDFYYEPTLDDNNKNAYSTEINEIKYCKCNIF